ncbi:MAG: N-acetylmuramidase domain-containing protein, partial [Terricaulis sp.]
PAPPPATPPAPPPATPPEPPPATPPAPPPEPPPAGPPPGFSLDALRAQDATRVPDAEISALAERFGADANVVKAILRVESAGPGFSGGKILISFEPFYFSELTGHRFDASHPTISSSTSRAPIAGNQTARWAKLAEAYALDPAAALGATSWGVFQLPGRYFATAGYANVFAFVEDMAKSEARQLAAFEAYVSRAGLADELQRRDWAAFAGEYEGGPNATSYANALAAAYAALPPSGDDGYIASLKAQNDAALTRADFEAAAAQLGCEVEAVQAVVEVESGRLGAFAADGRPIILYEPHIFSRRTNRMYDASHPTISYPTWDASKYPRTQEERWNQLKAAYALDPQNAIASASYGLFQIMGFNHAACGFPDPKSFVADMSKSQAQQLKAFTAFVRANNLADELVRKDWEGFARGYNGSGQVERYGGLMRDAYNRLKGVA